MQNWDEVSSGLLSVTLGHTALGYKDAVAPRCANPQPLWSFVDFREVFKCAGKFLAISSHQAGTKGAC